MKIRLGFVSNSSSSSFILDKNSISDIYLDIILNPSRYIKAVEKEYRKKNHIEESIIEAFEYVEDYKMWEISEKEDTISFSTAMDNFRWKEYVDIVKSFNLRELANIYLSS